MSSSVIIPLNHPVKFDNATLGARVCRGPHWDFDNDDGGPGSVGIIVAIVRGQTPASSGKRFAKVKWRSNGATGLYRIGCDEGAFCDLAYAEAVVAPALEGTPVDARSNLVIGARVSRADTAQWEWGNSQHEQLVQPGGALIVGADAESGWVRVRFNDGTVQVYRAGVADGGAVHYDLVYGSCGAEASSSSLLAASAMGSTTSSAPAAASANNNNVPSSTEPRGGDLVTPQNFRPGARVVANRRNGDWRWGNQDVENGGWAQLVRLDTDNWARVKWASGVKRSYRAGADSAFDLCFDDNPMQPRLPSSPPSCAAAAGAPAAASSSAASPLTAKALIPATVPEKFTAAFPRLEPIVIESVLYGRAEDTALAILEAMNTEAELHHKKMEEDQQKQQQQQQKSVPNIDDILADPPPRAEAEGPVVIKLTKKQATEEDACLICLDKPRVFACVPCGCVVACTDCVDSVKRNNRSCIRCRGPVQMMIKIFL